MKMPFWCRQDNQENKALNENKRRKRNKLLRDVKIGMAEKAYETMIYTSEPTSSYFIHQQLPFQGQNRYRF